MINRFVQSMIIGSSVPELSRKFIALTLLSIFLSWSFPIAPAQAAAGDLDSSFGSGGRVTTSIQFTEEAFGLAIQADGKIVAVGFSLGVSSDFTVVRYNTDGTLDTSFGTGGHVRTVFDQGSFASDVAIQPDGKIVVVGVAFTFISDNLDIAVARYNPDGSLDATFGSGGKLTNNINGREEVAAVGIQQDGKIVVGGSTVAGGLATHDFALVRYNANGALDPSFGSGGIAVTDYFGASDFLADLAIQPDGKITVVGDARLSESHVSEVALARYNPDGSLDGTFGSGGKLTTSFDNNGGGTGVALQSDGKIVVAATSFSIITGGDFALGRFNANGSLDTSFGSGGKVTTDILGSADQARDLAIFPGGKIVVGGVSLSGSHQDFSLARYNADGSLDTSFGSGGKTSTDFSGDGDIDRLNRVAIQADGKVVAAGGASIVNGDFALARYEGDGGGANFDICIQDDSSGDLFKFNSVTGDYQFTRCSDRFTSGGSGALIRKGGAITLEHNAPDRRILARIDTSVNRGTASIQVFPTASIQVFPSAVSFAIADRSTINNSCACR